MWWLWFIAGFAVAVVLAVAVFAWWLDGFYWRK